MIKVSIIIPVYGVEPYLRDCLDSVAAQTLPEIEVLCIDDASPDGCPLILDEYARKDPRFSVFHLEKNRRQGYGRNLGLSKAQGKYVYFLDSDDRIAPDAMAILYRTAEEEDLEGIFFDSEPLFESEELRKRFAGTGAMRRTGVYPDGSTDGQTLAAAFLEQQEWSVLVQRQFWRREYLQENGICFPEDAEHEDQFFSIASVLAASRVRYLPLPLFIRRYRDNSVVTSDPAPKNFHGYLVNAWMLLSFLRKKGIGGEPAETFVRGLFRNMKRLYPVFQKEEDPFSWFAGHGLEDVYSFYKYTAGNDEWERECDRKRFAPLTEYSSIQIYGAGRVGQSVFRRLRAIGIEPEGFLVTDREGNPEELFHKPVLPLSEYVPRTGEAVLVAMAAERHREVSELLLQKHIPHFLYARDRMTGPY